MPVAYRCMEHMFGAPATPGVSGAEKIKVHRGAGASNAGGLKVRLNGKERKSPSAMLTGRDILILFGLVPEDYELFLKQCDCEYEPVMLNEVVDIDIQSGETFLAKPREQCIIFVDGESMEVRNRSLSAMQIVAMAGSDPRCSYLKQIIAHRKISYRKDPEYDIRMANGLKFSICRLE